MIEYVGRSGEPEAMNCPAFVCDGCREQVAGPGNVLWAVWIDAQGNLPRKSTPLFVAHKGRCDQAVKRLMEHLYPSDDGWIPGWDEVDRLVRQLSYNAAHAFADDSDGTYHDHDLVQPGGTVLPNLKERP